MSHMFAIREDLLLEWEYLTRRLREVEEALRASPVIEYTAQNPSPYEEEDVQVGEDPLKNLPASSPIDEERRQVLEAMMEHIPLGITIADAESMTIRTISRYGREMIAEQGEKVQGIPLTVLTQVLTAYEADGITPIPFEQFPLVRAIREGAVIQQQEMVIVRTDGTRVPLLCTAGPIRDAAGSITGGVVVWQDIEERKRTEEEIQRLNTELQRGMDELREANRELQAFNYSVSHDLRTPLSVLDGYSHLLQEEYADHLDEEAQGYLTGIRTSIQKMDRLIARLLAFSRAGRQPLAVAEIDMERLVNEVFEEERQTESERDVWFRVGAMPPAQGDWSLVRQVLANLLGNALKFTRGRKPAVIEIGGESREADNLYFVRDNGIGFDASQAEKMFVEFQRLQTFDEYEGSGVGLSIVQRIVERHGGRVWAEGRPNEGAVFFFHAAVCPAGIRTPIVT